MRRSLPIGLLGLCLAASGCASRDPAGEPDITYEITGSKPVMVWAQYLREAQREEGTGTLRGAQTQERTRSPFTANVHLGESWTHAWIEAKTEPVDPAAKLHCVLKHNGVVLTEGDGIGFVSCSARSNGEAPPPPRPSA